MKKAQLTLETIIMLVVLMVLAGVMITLILNTLKPPSSPEKVLSKKEFLQKCENYCNDPERIGEYCSLFWEGKDWDEDKIPNELINLTSFNWPACEDRIYCFLVQPCERLGGGLELIRTCKDILCGVYLDKYGNVNDANQALKENILLTKDPTCKAKFDRLEEREKRWYKVFEEGCGAPITPTTTTTTTIPSAPTPPSPPPLP
jgi:hypothetical protein